MTVLRALKILPFLGKLLGEEFPELKEETGKVRWADQGRGNRKLEHGGHALDERTRGVRNWAQEIPNLTTPVGSLRLKMILRL